MYVARPLQPPDHHSPYPCHPAAVRRTPSFSQLVLETDNLRVGGSGAQQQPATGQGIIRVTGDMDSANPVRMPLPTAASRGHSSSGAAEAGPQVVFGAGVRPASVPVSRRTSHHSDSGGAAELSVVGTSCSGSATPSGQVSCPAALLKTARAYAACSVQEELYSSCTLNSAAAPHLRNSSCTIMLLPAATYCSLRSCR